MSSGLEIVAIVGAILGSVTVCCVKLMHQIQNSKCSVIRCCGNECIRDVAIDHPEVSTSSNKETEMVPVAQAPPASTLQIPRVQGEPKVMGVSQLRRVYSKRFETKPPAKYTKPPEKEEVV